MNNCKIIINLDNAAQVKAASMFFLSLDGAFVQGDTAEAKVEAKPTAYVKSLEVVDPETVKPTAEKAPAQTAPAQTAPDQTPPGEKAVAEADEHAAIKKKLDRQFTRKDLNRLAAKLGTDGAAYRGKPELLDDLYDLALAKGTTFEELDKAPAQTAPAQTAPANEQDLAAKRTEIAELVSEHVGGPNKETLRPAIIAKIGEYGAKNIPGVPAGRTGEFLEYLKSLS